jgi:Flp pilus assembly protein TadG
MIEKFKSSNGQTMVEFAFILVLLLILVLGIMEFAIVLYDKAVLTDGCREGARAGVVFRADSNTFDYSPLTAAEIRTIVGNYLQDRLVTFGTGFDASTDVTPQWSSDGGTTWNSILPTSPGSGDLLRVDVVFTYRFLGLPQLGALSGPTLGMAARSIMRME